MYKVHLWNPLAHRTTALAVASPDHETFTTLWNAWKALNGKVYTPVEEELRFRDIH